MLLYFLLTVEISLAAPLNKDVYKLPPSALEELSSKGTIILEAALKNALLVLDEVLKKINLHLKECNYCAVCLFKHCSNRTTQCVSGVPPTSEPSCDIILRAQMLEAEAERQWELSKACWYYQTYCPEGRHRKVGCLKQMEERCHARILQCSQTGSLKSLNSVLNSERKATCGQKAATSNDTVAMGRIVGGNIAARGSWPWLVLLTLNGNVMCGGVLVQHSWVVTAAHCFTGNRNENYWRVVIGEYDLKKQDTEERILQVNRIITHPKFNQRTFNNDIALLELTVPIAISEHVNFVCLPESIGELPPETMCYIAGWGSRYEDGPSADVLIEAKVPLLGQSTCKAALGKELVTNQMFCAGYLSGNVDSCQGDSGGPLTCLDPVSKRYYLYGITSWGDGCGQRGKPGVYSRVSSFINWINNEIKKSPGSREPTCFDFDKLSEMPDAQRRSVMTTLCEFYRSLCPPLLETTACSRCIEERCKMKMKKCELRTFLQNLLDLLHPVEEFIRSQASFSFFTETIPKFMEEIYTNIFPSQEQHLSKHDREQIQRTGLKEERYGRSPETHLASDVQHNISNRTVEMGTIDVQALFKDIGPDLDNWINHFTEITESFRPADFADEEKEQESTASKERQFFFQNSKKEMESLKEQFQILIGSLKSKREMDELLAHMQKMPHDAGRLSLTSSKHNGLNTSQNDLKVKKRDISNVLPDSGTFLKTSGCQSVNESLLNVSSLMDEYRWILTIPTEKLSMQFQEVLVDMASKNEKGLFKARVKAVVGGQHATFHSLVGLENDSFYRSMARVIALALDALKT
ncbi:serine protease 56 [Scyliorhinus canicula]|uniref:serine protease 56 n=1 Tax=Scyliorhinus canicula TaxID=7830 RepID=UPI0018F78164|nr:serine protease 56 [Scyliorhinus canicula]